MKTISEIRHANLLALITEAGGVSRFAEKIERSHSQVSQLKNKTPHSKSKEPREIGDDLARHIEKLCGRRSGWMDTQHPAFKGEAIQIEELDEFTVPPISKWEDLLNETHRTRLRIVAPDDALPDDAPRGTEIILSTTDMTPQRGDIVLVRDSHGTHYLRRYAEGRGGAWRAVTGRGDGVYLDLDSATDGLVLVAVADWIKPRRG